MIRLKYPDFNFQLKGQEGEEEIWDVIRKQWVSLTPEEWVRQNFIQYLIQHKNYPASLIAVEKEISLNRQKRRFDIVTFKYNEPQLLIECKQMDEVLNEAVLAQVLSYQSVVSAKAIVLTNGHTTFCAVSKNGQFEWSDTIPDFNEI